jgi:hypothetical protein
MFSLPEAGLGGGDELVALDAQPEVEKEVEAGTVRGDLRGTGPGEAREQEDAQNCGTIPQHHEPPRPGALEVTDVREHRGSPAMTVKLGGRPMTRLPSST